ncbi:pentapeptide repeat-containing protein [Streptomyces sp. NPDC014773]|uniref:pentapeptide repeat-containing protein n=1 Tax=Streptomyces sp. NPDC014773 TaxID=3364908 RepID=UPI0036FCA3E0
MPLHRFSVICSIADVCDVEPVWVPGQFYRLRNDGGTSGHACVPALRTVLRRSGPILSGRPGLVPTSRPSDLARMRAQTGAVNRALPGAALSGAALSGAALSGAALSGAALSGAALSGAGSVLPGLSEELNTALLAHDFGIEREQAPRLRADASRNARQTLNQLGHPDLAGVAADVAAHAAREPDDPTSRAAVARDRWGAMLHQGSSQETEAIGPGTIRARRCSGPTGGG